MVVTRVSITEPDPGSRECLLAYPAVEVDGSLLIRNLKLIQRADGTALVDFPSEPLFDRCGGCGKKVDCVAYFCGWCGVPHEPWGRPKPEDGRRSNFVNVVHPTNAHGRHVVEQAVMTEYRRFKSRQQGECS